MIGLSYWRFGESFAIPTLRTSYLVAQMTALLLVRFTGLMANNSFKSTPHRGIGHVPALR